MSLRVGLGTCSYTITISESYAGLPRQLSQLDLPREGWVITHARLLAGKPGRELLSVLKRGGWAIQTLTIPERETVYAFLSLYRSLGYENCPDGLFEAAYEKVAIYALNNVVKHTARQLSNGNWTSKVGQNIDIEHSTLAALEGPKYGSVVRYLKRAL